ncbi:MAG: glycerol-3-phosphate acyltransferase, partial [Dehalococcoidia bacterium]|nr:glycerol-3-phosphate acyltransferase [Dehalococcoidia bacterium]
MTVLILKVVIILVLGYLLGSIPFGAIAAKLRGGIDITKYGSGRIGVTNVLRT